MMITVYLKDDDDFDPGGHLVAEAVRVVDDLCEQCGGVGESYVFTSVSSGMTNNFCLACLIEDEDGVEKIVIE